MPLYTHFPPHMLIISSICPSITQSSPPPLFHFPGVYGNFESFANDLMGVFLDVLDAPAHHLGECNCKCKCRTTANLSLEGDQVLINMLSMKHLETDRPVHVHMYIYTHTNTHTNAQQDSNHSCKQGI